MPSAVTQAIRAANLILNDWEDEWRPDGVLDDLLRAEILLHAVDEKEVEKLLRASLTANAPSYFTVCERDKHGWCMSAGGSGELHKAMHQHAYIDQPTARAILSAGTSHAEYNSNKHQLPAGTAFSDFHDALQAIAKGHWTAPTHVPPAAVDPLHTALGLVAHLKAVKGAVKFSVNDLLKLAHLNSNGVQGGVLRVPQRMMKQPAQMGALSAVLPHGTRFIAVKVKSLSVVPASLAAAVRSTPPASAPKRPAYVSPKAASPQPAPTSGLPHLGGESNVPHADQTTWITTTPHPTPQVLHGVPFAPAPPKFWEHTPDVTGINEPPPLKPIQRASVIIREPDGRMWIASPTNGYAQRKHTLPGGTLEPGLTIQQNAMKEVWEETGLQVKITGYLGDFTDSNNGKMGRTYLAVRVGGVPWGAKQEPASKIPPSAKHGTTAESDEVHLVTPEKAAKMLHRQDDLAQLMTVVPIKLKSKVNSEKMKKLVEGVEPAAKVYADRVGVNPGDTTLHVVQNLRGFNGKPAVVSKAEMDALIASGTHIEMLRGIDDVPGKTGKELAEQFRTGDHYPGYGMYGNGTYADAKKGMDNVVTNGRYGSGSSSSGHIRLALPKTAKIVEFSELKAATGAKHPDGYTVPPLRSHSDYWRGVHAALAGYDAIHVDTGRGNYGHDYYIILNRSILTVQQEDAKGHRIK